MNKELLRENRVHGHSLFPVSVYPGVDQLNGDSILDCHWHDEMEIILMEQGSAVFHVDMNVYEVKAGEAIFVGSGEIHAGYLLGEERCIFSAIVFDSSWLAGPSYDALQENLIDPLMTKRLIPPRHIKKNTLWGASILEHINRILSEHEEKKRTLEISTKAHLYLIFAEMFEQMQVNDQHTNRVTGSPDKIDRIKMALNYVHEHYNESIKLKDLAAHLNMSEGHFCRFFKQMVQKSPIDYINHYRIQKACKLLENTNYKVVDIAMEVGFDNLSYFITLFKKQKEKTPSQYRKLFYEQIAIEAMTI
ncbi:AraC family transcriptional regulator [Paenibacillus sp. Marseille-Q4541]|uniref:helix-turn-helix transcriptional regulator n=1 Tax=Paenibacillus sp. Marseille-Q4541 TaxID=2831522 RepID=UPI001BA9BC0F|nr:AraC family transcriptional regulator [Paenibacillus sp. Marseille-Q4541]